jgi:hypothetical protein
MILKVSKFSKDLMLLDLFIYTLTEAYTLI